jgi:hypothetical protein
MKQSKLMSMIETALSTAIGFAVALTTQLLIFPLFGFNPPLSHNLLIGAIFTIVSIARGFLVRRLFEALHIRNPLSAGALAIIAERRRQIEQEGWTAEHDVNHGRGELARAGACYLLMAAKWPGHAEPWPWHKDDLKEKEFRKNVVRGGALALAELDRFDVERKQRVAA